MVTPPVQNDEVTVPTKALGKDWQCEQCGSMNRPWRNNCLLCRKEYNPSLGRLLLSFQSIIATMVEFDNGSGIMTDDKINNRVELPGKLYMVYAPSAWYENAVAKRYYTDITKTLQYTSGSDYAEGVDVAWYRAVRMLYPGKTNPATAKKTYDRFILDEGRNLSGQKGAGIKAGAKAAVEAYDAYN